MKSFFKKILHDIDWLTNNPIYQLLVSIALVGVSIYDSVKVIIQDVGSLHFKKEHFVILIGVLMLINSINNLFKGVKKLDKSVETLEEERERQGSTR
ncbi:MAG TPA: hypothetical protein DCS93_44670 [Microscillaceae bacterium]|nr:hypothetical protein [Microscillaceae bacterium]